MEMWWPFNRTSEPTVEEEIVQEEVVQEVQEEDEEGSIDSTELIDEKMLITTTDYDEWYKMLTTYAYLIYFTNQYNPLRYWSLKRDQRRVLTLLQHGCNAANTHFTPNEISDMDPYILIMLQIAGCPDVTEFGDKIQKMQSEVDTCVSYLPHDPIFPASYIPFLSDHQNINMQLERARTLDHICTHLSSLHTLVWIVKNNSYNSEN